MTDSELISILESHGVKPTPNRILLVRALETAGRPLSMTELETAVDSIDKSNVFRTLQTFREARLVHAIEDSGSGVRYELCHSHPNESDNDLHVHFYCERCHRTFCLEEIPVPSVDVPSSFTVSSVSYLLKGLCPECRR